MNPPVTADPSIDGVMTPCPCIAESIGPNDTSPEGLHLQPQVLDQAVTAATLCGAATRAEARAALASLPALGGQPENVVIALGNWLADLYPAPPGQEWGALQPDRVGEHLVATTLTEDPRMLPALLATAGAAQRHQALSVLARALANPTIAADLRDRLGEPRDVITTGVDGADLAGIALQVATETADPRRLIDTIRAGIAPLDTTHSNQSPGSSPNAPWPWPTSPPRSPPSWSTGSAGPQPIPSTSIPATSPDG